MRMLRTRRAHVRLAYRDDRRSRRLASSSALMAQGSFGKQAKTSAPNGSSATPSISSIACRRQALALQLGLPSAIARSRSLRCIHRPTQGPPGTDWGGTSGDVAMHVQAKGNQVGVKPHDTWRFTYNHTTDPASVKTQINSCKSIRSLTSTQPANSFHGPSNSQLALGHDAHTPAAPGAQSRRQLRDRPIPHAWREGLHLFTEVAGGPPWSRPRCSRPGRGWRGCLRAGRAGLRATRQACPTPASAAPGGPSRRSAPPPDPSQSSHHFAGAHTRCSWTRTSRATLGFCHVPD